MSSAPVALVTGASSGIGLATAKALSKAGFRVFGTSRTASPPTRDKGDITMIACDVTNDMSVAKAVDEVMYQAGRIDVLVNNAGVGLLAAAEESSMQQTASLFDINVFGPIRMTQMVLPIMRDQRRGRIINLSSILGLIPAPYSALYASTKHAVEGYSESLDHEVRAFGIRVIVVEPGYTRTLFGHNTVAPDRPLQPYASAREMMARQSRASVESGDSPEVVAETIVHAATADKVRSRYTSGKFAGRVRMLRRFVPEAAFDKSLRKQNNLPA